MSYYSEPNGPLLARSSCRILVLIYGLGVPADL